MKLLDQCDLNSISYPTLYYTRLYKQLYVAIQQSKSIDRIESVNMKHQYCQLWFTIRALGANITVTFLINSWLTWRGQFFNSFIAWNCCPNQYFTRLCITWLQRNQIKLVLRGMGYTMRSTSPFVLEFQLGYSHALIVVLPRTIIARIVGRKNRILLLSGSPQHVLVQATNRLMRGLRKLDPYRDKGMRPIFQTRRLRAGKKAFS